MDHDSPPTIIAYDVGFQGCDILPSSSRRAWMDATRDGFAYRCLPMLIANAFGWDVVCPAGFVACWNGGLHKKEDIAIRFDEVCIPFVQSHFMRGILTFHTGYLFRTPPDVNLWVRGPANSPRDGLQALEGIVETDWSPATFTMNWMFTRPGEVRFEKGEPFCTLLPYPRRYIEEFQGRFAHLADNPDLKASFDTWQRGRADFLQNLPNPNHVAHKQRWQKDYMLGKGGTGTVVNEHQTKLTLKPFQGRAPSSGQVEASSKPAVAALETISIDVRPSFDP